jgi:hypothetical protein
VLRDVRDHDIAIGVGTAEIGGQRIRVEKLTGAVCDPLHVRFVMNQSQNEKLKLAFLKAELGSSTFEMQG